jgi:hypothetical protein
MIYTVLLTLPGRIGPSGMDGPLIATLRVPAAKLVNMERASIRLARRFLTFVFMTIFTAFSALFSKRNRRDSDGIPNTKFKLIIAYLSYKVKV